MRAAKAASPTAFAFARPRALARLRTMNSVETRRSLVRRCASVTDELSADQCKALLEVAQRAAEAGGEVIWDAVDKPRNIEFKGATDLVTQTDKDAEKAILGVIMAAYGEEHGVLGEEGGVYGNASSEYLWCVDPLDGTTNFAHSYPSFAASVAVLYKARPVAACVVAFGGGPHSWSSAVYTAAKGNGAYCNGNRISVSDVSDLQQSLLVTGFGYDHGAAWSCNLDLFRHFTDVTQGVRRLGAAAVDMCLVAMGVNDAYWEFDLKPWDMAAGALMIEEAGGKVTTMDGKDFTAFDKTILASNSTKLHEAIQEKTGPAVADLASKGVEFERWFIPEGYAQWL
ncbi:unnamed protein product [Pedinophyceae sp. YPF-701]|nr:unnamed protein product [Pedinophyceae sp. YPF-701]